MFDTMMHSTWGLVLIAVFLAAVAGGAYAALRVYGAREVSGDHPKSDD